KIIWRTADQFCCLVSSRLSDCDASPDGCLARGGPASGTSSSGEAVETSVAVRSMVGAGRLRRRAPSAGSGVVRLSDMRASFNESAQPRIQEITQKPFHTQ